MLRTAQRRAGLPEEVVVTQKVYLEYAESRTGGQAEDPDDRWTSYSDDVDFRPVALGVTQSGANWRNETIEVDFDPYVGKDVVLVVVRYKTGSTFGSIVGVWQIIGAFEDKEEAYKAKDLIAKYNDGEVKDFEKKMSELTSQEHFFVSWSGYFERFIDTEMHYMKLTV